MWQLFSSMSTFHISIYPLGIFGDFNLTGITCTTAEARVDLSGYLKLTGMITMNEYLFP